MKQVFFILLLLVGISKISQAQLFVPNERAKTLQSRLKLDDAQTVKITKFYQEMLDGLREIIKAGGDGNVAGKKIAEINAATKVKIKSVLTKEQNIGYEKWLIENTKKAASVQPKSKQ